MQMPQGKENPTQNDHKRQWCVTLFYFTNEGEKNILKKQTTAFTHLSSSAWVWHRPIFHQNNELSMSCWYISAVYQVCTVNTMWWSKYVQSYYWHLAADSRTPARVHRSWCSVKMFSVLESSVSSAGTSWLFSKDTK